MTIKITPNDHGNAPGKLTDATMKLLGLAQSIDDDHPADAAHDDYRARIEAVMQAELARTSCDPEVTLPADGISLADIEKAAILEALKRTNWHQRNAAALLRISPRVINAKIHAFNIQPPADMISRCHWGHI